MSFLFRKKNFSPDALTETNLSRVLKLFDLTCLGISSTFGSGIYVLAGDVIANFAGPSIIFSFIIAGLCSFLAGLCYAELGSRVPRSGSAYVYIYVTIGEFIAFIIGWDVILEYIIGTSSTASALSQYIDEMTNNTISSAFQNAMPINVPGLGPYPDFLAFSLSLIVTVILVAGVRESSFLNTIFTILNIIVILFIIIAGSIKGDAKNWSLKTKPNTEWVNYDGINQTCGNSTRCGNGGFFPFGIEGVLKGTAKCFYAFIGFDCISATAEEVQNPKKTLPLSIIITLIVVSIGYTSVSAVLTAMIPYYILDPSTPLTQAFEYVNLGWASYVVSVGAIISLATCLYASMFPMPRVVYSMASDGLIFKRFSYILPKVKTPVFACLFTGLFSGFMSLIFDLNQLIDMLSIGTLLAYILVSACTLILRYRPTDDSDEKKPATTQNSKTFISFLFGESDENILDRMFFPASKVCNRETAHLCSTITVFASILILMLSILLNLADLTKFYVLIFVGDFLLVISICVYILWRQPQNQDIKTFKVPLVPLFPILSIFFNVYLITKLSFATWIRFSVWFALGIVVYFSYGMKHSKENKDDTNSCGCSTKNITKAIKN